MITSDTERGYGSHFRFRSTVETDLYDRSFLSVEMSTPRPASFPKLSTTYVVGVIWARKRIVAVLLQASILAFTAHKVALIIDDCYWNALTMPHYDPVRWFVLAVWNFSSYAFQPLAIGLLACWAISRLADRKEVRRDG